MRRAVPLLFFLGGSLLLLFGLGSLGAAFVLGGSRVPDGFSWTPPLEQVDNRALVPATVLLPLTGLPAGDALNAALDHGDWENAYALIAYDPSLADPTRIGALLQLGARFAAAQESSQAAWCYVAAMRIATLSPRLSDPVREDTYLQASTGLRSVDAQGAARWAADQAYLVAQYAPVMTRDPRLRRLDQVANAYTALHADALANQARNKANDVPTAEGEEQALLPREPFVLTVGKLPQSSEVDNAVQVRVAAAEQLLNDIKDIAAGRASDWPQDSIGQLQDALKKEDQARASYYDQELAATQDAGVQLALLQDKVDWLGVKYRVARGAFGADLVPEWSKDAAAIASSWSDAWGELFRFYESQAAAIPNAQAVSQAEEDIAREELLALRWGWYRGATEQDLHATLAGLTRELRDASIPSLRVDLLTVGGRTTDLLVPDELYGKNEQALPK